MHKRKKGNYMSLYWKYTAEIYATKYLLAMKLPEVY